LHSTDQFISLTPEDTSLAPGLSKIEKQDAPLAVVVVTVYLFDHHKKSCNENIQYKGVTQRSRHVILSPAKK
jgi:hypothetical protein